MNQVCTLFWDMHSGGGSKEKWEKIYIEAPEAEARAVFYNRFGHSPDRVSCTCCGEDYSVSEESDFAQASAYHRNCDSAYFDPHGNECDESEAWVRGKGMKEGYSHGYIERSRRPESKYTQHVSVEDYLKQDGVLLIRADEIKPEERTADIPAQGYVWI